MKNLFRSKAPPGWRGAVLLFRFVLLLLLIPAAVQAQQEFAKTADLPDYSIKMWVDVWRPDILMFGRWVKPLGDINNDGYDDIAVASFADTTFIFLGGEEFSHDPYMFLLGGGGGIAVGDFNGDRRVDIVTAIVQGVHRRGESDPDWRGKIRFYFGKGIGAPFDTIPDLVLQGRAMESFGMYTNGRRPALTALDYNGDGYSDLLVPEVNLEGGPSIRLALYQGWTTLDTVPVGFLQAREEIAKQYFVDDVMTGDINADGYDDILVHGSYSFFPSPAVRYWDVHLGNDAMNTGTIDRVLSSDSGWAPEKNGASNLVDINADGCSDIIDAFFPDDPGDIQLFLSDFILPETILPNDTIPNTDRMGLRKPAFICPAGDMNGDGWEDALIAWSDQIFRFGNLYLLYPGGPSQSYKTPLGVFGILSDEQHLQIGSYPIGDVNGDGCDDVAVLGLPEIETAPQRYRFRIYLGSRAMKTALDAVPESRPLHFGIHPNPVQVTQDQVLVTVNSTDQSPIRLNLTDILGREVHQMSITMTSTSRSIGLSTNELAPGRYQITVTQGKTIVSQPLIVY